MAAQCHFDEIKAILQSESYDFGEPFLNLEKSFQQKVDYSNEVLEYFRIYGREQAEIFIRTNQGTVVNRQLLVAI